jgi:hypothetical protein
MSDFTSIVTDYNTGTDASPTWSGTSLAFAGTSGANELRFAPSSGATTTTASASWPVIQHPTSGTAVVPQLWAFTADTTGLQTIYDGTNSKSNVLRWHWDNTGTMVAAPQFTAYANSTHTAPSAGTQPAGTNNDPITNGQSSDTSSTSYLKAAAWGSVVAPASSLTAGSAGSAPSATTGTAGAITTTASAWSTWQSLQGAIQYIVFTGTPAATTANTWNWTCILYLGANISTGTITPICTFTYVYS